MTLHTQLAADTIPITSLEFCDVLLMNDARFPWLILVPRVPNAREIFDLDEAQYNGVMQEVHHAAKKFQTYTRADKMNVAALGNMVPQLHIHVIARFTTDVAWPKPIWCVQGGNVVYDAETLAAHKKAIKAVL